MIWNTQTRTWKIIVLCVGNTVGLKFFFPADGIFFSIWFCWWPEVELNHRHTDFQSAIVNICRLLCSTI